MKTKAMLQLIILAIFVSSSTQQTQNPTCQPLKLTNTFKKTLFVFVAESSGTLDQYIKYVIKQFACTIPEAEDIKSYILDYTDESTLRPVSEEDFSTSPNFIGKIANSLPGPTNGRSNCARMKKFYTHFSNQDSVKKYTNVKYIVYPDSACPLLGTTENWLAFDIVTLNNKFWYVQHSQIAIAVQSQDADASEFLKDSFKKTIGTFLGDDSLWQTAASSSSNDNNKSQEILVTIQIVVLVVMVLIIIALVGSVVATCIHFKGKDKKKKKGNNIKSQSNVSSNASGYDLEDKKKVGEHKAGGNNNQIAEGNKKEEEK